MRNFCRKCGQRFRDENGHPTHTGMKCPILPSEGAPATTPKRSRKPKIVQRVSQYYKQVALEQTGNKAHFALGVLSVLERLAQANIDEDTLSRILDGL